jgi:hypothetical protein
VGAENRLGAKEKKSPSWAKRRQALIAVRDFFSEEKHVSAREYGTSNKRFKNVCNV